MNAKRPADGEASAFLGSNGRALTTGDGAEDAFRDLLRGKTRKPPIAPQAIVIEGVATSSRSAPIPDVEAPSRAPAPSPRGGVSRLGMIAGVTVALGFGVSSGVLLARWVADVEEINSRAEELRGRLSALEGEKLGSKLANLRLDIEKMLGARDERMAKLDDRMDRAERDANARLDDVAGRVDTMTNALIAREATGVTPAPSSGATVLARRKPTPGGWILRDVRDGLAIVEGASGMREVALGDVLPGAGRVRRIEKRGGVWSLFTAAGVIDQEAN